MIFSYKSLIPFCFLERFIRALPPKYLAIDGHEDCTVSYKISSSSALCFPLSKPPSCSDASWQSLGKAYGVNNGISERINIGGIGGLPPAYLSVEGHEDCLGIFFINHNFCRYIRISDKYLIYSGAPLKGGPLGPWTPQF